MARRIAFVLTVAIVMGCPHRAVAVELADCAVHCDVELARLRAELAQARGDCTIMQRRIDALELELRHSESDRHDRSAAAGPLLAFAPFCTRRRASKKRVPFFAQGVDGDSPCLAACRRWACTGMHPLPRTVEGGRCSAGPARVRQRPHSSLSAFGRLCSADPCKYSNDGTCDAPSSYCPIGDYNDCGTEPVTTPARNPHPALAPSVPHT